MTTAAGLAPTREVLQNGVRVLVKETRTTPAITLHINLLAGSVCDPLDGPGLSHFVSRAIDRGSQRHSAEQIAETLDSRGVSLATAVGRHTLSLVCTCLAEDFAPVLELLGEIVMRPVFPAHEVDRRRGEIITMIRQDQDSPSAVAVDALLEMLYGPHPYGRNMRGSVESVERMNRDALEKFHATWCGPGGMSIACVGDIEPARALDGVRTVFGEWRTSGPPTATAVPLPGSGSRRTRVIPMMNKSQTDIAYGFTAITRSDPSYPAFWLMNTILGQYSLGGRLGDSIREQQGMAYYVFSSLDANLMPGPLVIRAGVSPANVSRAVASIDSELAKLVTDGATEQELQESKQYLIGSMPRMLETNGGIALYLQTVELFSLGLDYDVRVPALVNAVSLDDVNRAARSLVDPGRATVVVAGPYEGSLS